MIQRMAKMVRNAEVLVVGTGAGMGKDSGLPDFRGNEGFWNNYPPYRGKFKFVECANPSFLHEHPHLFWGFYGHRLAMYRSSTPHRGYSILKEIANKINPSPSSPSQNYFAFTSNVDGHFQRADYPASHLYEVHGSIHHLQCYNCQQITENDFLPEVDEETMSCGNLPKCKKCGENLRPNILMFGDWQWLDEKSFQQEQRYRQFIKTNASRRKILVEIGCGQAVPTIRNMMQQLLLKYDNACLIRINPDPEKASYLQEERYMHLQMGGLQGITKIREALEY